MHHHQSTLEYSNSLHLHHHNTVSQEVGLEINASLPYKVQYSLENCYSKLAKIHIDSLITVIYLENEAY